MTSKPSWPSTTVRRTDPSVADILVPDVPEDVVAAIDMKAQRLGLSRADFLRRVLTRERAPQRCRSRSPIWPASPRRSPTSMTPMSRAAPGDDGTEPTSCVLSAKPAPTAAGSTTHCRSCTATGWSGSSTPPPTATPECCGSTPSTRTCRSARRWQPRSTARSSTWRGGWRWTSLGPAEPAGGRRQIADRSSASHHAAQEVEPRPQTQLVIRSRSA